MFYRTVSVVLVAVLLHGSVAAQDQTQSAQQTVAKIRQVLHKAQDKDKAVEVTLTKAIDNRKKFMGKVSEISDTGFVLTDRKSGELQKLAYEDVERIKQKELSKGAKSSSSVSQLELLQLSWYLRRRRNAGSWTTIVRCHSWLGVHHGTMRSWMPTRSFVLWWVNGALLHCEGRGGNCCLIA